MPYRVKNQESSIGFENLAYLQSIESKCKALLAFYKWQSLRLGIISLTNFDKKTVLGGPKQYSAWSIIEENLFCLISFFSVLIEQALTWILRSRLFKSAENWAGYTILNLTMQNFTSQILAFFFLWSIFWLVTSFSMINYLGGACSGRLIQGCHFPDNMKFPDFSRPRLGSSMNPRPVRGVWVLPQKIFKIRIFNLAENEFQTTKFPDFWNSVANSLTFRGLFQIPWLFQVFQVSGNPVNKAFWCFRMASNIARLVM